MAVKKELKEVKIPCGDVVLNGFLNVPQEAKGIVVFVHGSGSTRFSPRNQYVATCMQEANIAILLFDLLTPHEEEVDNVTRDLRFNVSLLSERLIVVTDWLSKHPETRPLTIGYFGASTGAAAALIAAADLGVRISSVVSRGGRPDLAGHALSHVQCPTLLIVGGDDHAVIELNQRSFDLLACKKRLEIIPGATHLFEEPGALGTVAHMATIWFSEYL